MTTPKDPVNQQEPYLTGRPIPPHLQQHDVVGDSPLNPRRQDALNARANQSWREAAGGEFYSSAGFGSERAAFEEGWETGYKAAEVDINAALEAEPASREYAVNILVDLLQEANRRDVAALERQGYPGIPEVPDDAMRAHCGHLVDALIAAKVIPS